MSAKRLRAGDVLLGVGSILLLVDLFTTTWFESIPEFHATSLISGQRVSLSGWESIDAVGPLALVVCLAGLGVCGLTATRRSPALPVVINTLLLPVALALAVLIAIRVLLEAPSVRLAHAVGGHVMGARPAADVGLALSVAICIGAFVGLRREGTATSDTPAVIQTISIEASSSSSHA